MVVASKKGGIKKKESILFKGRTGKETAFRTVYQALEIGGDICDVGDHVLIKQEDPDGLPFVAKVLCVFRERDEEPEVLKLRLQWYYRPKDIPITGLNFEKNEILCSGHCDDVDVETVEGLCTVWTPDDVKEKDHNTNSTLLYRNTSPQTPC
eukprot:m.32266 g.32266  ORF g.32266 m.32266 type:complete len:152 (+) comp6373_c1_seq1:47-502(+)